MGGYEGMISLSKGLEPWADTVISYDNADGVCMGN